MIEQGHSTDVIYTKMNEKRVSTVSETIKDPKFIDNRKYTRKIDNQDPNLERDSAAETILKSVKTGEFIKSATFNDQSYSTINYLAQMMEDIKSFCVIGEGILSVDTTFELCM